MTTINRFRFFIAATMAVVLTGFASCSDEPEMPLGDSPIVERDTAPSGGTAGETVADSLVNAEGGVVLSWTIDEGVESVTINGHKFKSGGSILVKAGSSVSWSATAKPRYMFTSPSHDTFEVLENAAGGAIYIPISTQKGNF